MKKATFTGLALSLLIAAGAPHQRASDPKGDRVDKGETMTGSDAEREVGEVIWRPDPDPSHLSDEDAIRLSRSFVGTPWENPQSRDGLLLSVDTAEGQLYLACLYVRSFDWYGSGMTNSSPPATKVVECCQKALALQPAYAEAYVVMSQGLTLMRRYKEAEAALENAIALRPDWASSYCELVSVLANQGRYGDALVASQQEDRISRQDAIRGSSTSYWGPCPMHSEKNDILMRDQIQFKIEHPNDVWLPNDRIRALGLNHDPIGWLNPRNADHR